MSAPVAEPQAVPALERKELGEHTTAPWKIRVLGECPAKFYLGAVAKDPRRKESGFEGRVGTLLHHGIEQVAWLRTWIAFGKKAELTAEELLRGIDQPSKSPSVESARRDPAALAEARVLAKKVAKYVDLAGMVVESVGTKLRPLVEEPWTLDVGEVDGRRVVVGGIWDFVRRSQGVVTITDWKKGGDLRGSDELRLDPAATLYAAAAKARWPKERVRVEHFFLTRGTSIGLDWTPEVDEWARMAALEHARAVLAFEREGRWPATPSLKACSYCSFRPTCTAFRERVTKRIGLGSFDASKKDDLEAVVLARAKAAEDVKLAEKWVEDLDQVLNPALARAAEAGADDLVLAGHRVRRAKRVSLAFDNWRYTVHRVWELTGIVPDEIEDAVLAFRVGALDEFLAVRGLAAEDRARIKRSIEETATERTATWLEVKPVADPMPSIDVDRIFETGVRVELPLPPLAHKVETVEGLDFCRACKLGTGDLTSECPGEPSFAFAQLVHDHRADFKGGRWVQLQPITNKNTPPAGPVPASPVGAPVAPVAHDTGTASGAPAGLAPGATAGGVSHTPGAQDAGPGPKAAPAHEAPGPASAPASSAEVAPAVVPLSAAPVITSAAPAAGATPGPQTPEGQGESSRLSIAAKAREQSPDDEVPRLSRPVVSTGRDGRTCFEPSLTEVLSRLGYTHRPTRDEATTGARIVERDRNGVYELFTGRSDEVWEWLRKTGQHPELRDPTPTPAYGTTLALAPGEPVGPDSFPGSGEGSHYMSQTKAQDLMPATKPAGAFDCEQCGRGFQNARGLASHRRSHVAKKEG